MFNVLVVEDERDLAALLKFNLEAAGLAVRVAHSGAEALAQIRAEKPDVVTLDVMLPDVSGREICRLIKSDPAFRSIAVLLLTARGEESDRIQGFESGADDYLVKPFSVRELVLRIKALQRRTGTTTELPSGPLTLGILRLDSDAHRCFVGDSELMLTALEFKLLWHLMSRPGRVQSRDQLLEDVWGMSRELETRTVDTHVMRLRDKLGAARSYVETVRGVGYRMMAPVEVSDVA